MSIRFKSPVYRIALPFFVTLLAGILLVLTMGIVSAEAPTMPACNSSAELTAFGWRTMPAGAATAVWTDMRPNLMLSNIGSSGQDGVCQDFSPARGVRHVFAEPLPIIGADSYDISADAIACANANRMSIDLVRSSATSAQIFANGFESGDVSFVAVVYDGNARKGSFQTGGSGDSMPIAALTGQVKLSELHMGNYLMDTFEKEEWLFAFDGQVEFTHGSDSFSGDRFLIYPAQNQIREICGARLTFVDHDGIADEIGINASAIQRGELWHGTPNNTPIQSLSIDAPFDLLANTDLVQVFNTDVQGWIGCLTCTMPVTDASFVHTFASPLRLTAADDEIVFSGLDGEESLFDVSINPAANGKPRFCPSFPTQSADIDLQILRDGEIILVRTLAPGECLTLPKRISVVSLAARSLCNNEVIEGSVQMQGVPGLLTVKIGPKSCNSTAFDPTDITVAHTRPFRVEIDGVSAGN